MKPNFIIRFAGVLACVGILQVSAADAVTEKVIYSFKGAPDGASPVGDLASDSSGALYGMTQFGGNSNTNTCPSGCGTIFKLTPPGTVGGAWTETVLHSFQGGTDGIVTGWPSGGVIIDTSGALYGLTPQGGLPGGCAIGSGFNGCGSVFMVTPPKVAGGKYTEKVLYRFLGGADGGFPVAGLVQDASGALYGTTEYGGITNWGVVFKLTPPATAGGSWTQSVIHSFQPSNGTDGFSPQGSLIIDSHGALYGTTTDAGQNCKATPFCGIVFKLTSHGSGDTWTEKVVYSFQGTADGGYPIGRLVLRNDVLYGTTEYGAGTGCGGNGCGSVFQLTPPAVAGGTWMENTIHTFLGQEGDGGNPITGLISGSLGAFYGTALEGGLNNIGTVYKLVPADGGTWNLRVRHTFAGPPHDGAYPGSDLLGPKGGPFYGTTGGGGTPTTQCSYGCGTVFSIMP